ncbi:AraC family transcriptional regulator [Paraburkholderia phymatum]|uniref:Transcriptional regulator, AraC family n=1 Tax=Paraburkholderia phymatum (strain DSM 17167 / CIP 108236 / LMG 21445 / STM815) TaxID=391038 RepID=B2JRK3_PARP8|nr:AraC family transcriptional regulator [Paraburkholderia phymatum]ACC72330.1 transcriptional regulator, AraC family [Paraburkholderia phymatum STM815]
MNANHPAWVPHSGARESLLSSASLGWSGFGAELLGISAGTHCLPAFAEHRVGVHVGAPVRAVCRCDGQRAARIQAHGDADVVPAGVDGEWSDDASCTVLRIWFADDFVRTTVDQLGPRSAHAHIRPQLQLRDARVQHLAWAMRAELEAEHACDPLYAESLCTAMIVRLAGAAPAGDGKRRTLSSRAAARVIDYIDAHLDGRLTLTELAALVELSVPHFKVLFRETMGVPLHRYVVQRRVERARELLLQGRSNASQVALEAGFAHQSHMAHWMKRLLGVTPRELLR